MVAVMHVSMGMHQIESNQQILITLFTFCKQLCHLHFQMPYMQIWHMFMGFKTRIHMILLLNTSDDFQIEEHLATSFRHFKTQAEHLIPDMADKNIIYTVQHSLPF
jgi:hypothetical protein